MKMYFMQIYHLMKIFRRISIALYCIRSMMIIVNIIANIMISNVINITIAFIIIVTCIIIIIIVVVSIIIILLLCL